MGINHIGSNKHNNRPANLELVTPAENARHVLHVLGANRGWKGLAKFTEEQVKHIRCLCA